MRRAFRLGWTKLLAIAALIISYAASVNATTVIIPKDEDLVISARAIITGKVVDISWGMDDRRVMVFTYVKVRVEEVIKGEISTREIVLKEQGGQYQGHYTVVDGVPQFNRGDHVLLYLDTWRDGSLRVHQMFLGQFSIVKDPATGKEFAVRATPGAHVEIMPNSTVKSGDGQATSRMELTAYKKMVRQTLAANRKTSDDFLAQHYRGIAIMDQPNEYRQMSAAGTLQPQYHLFDPPLRWFQPDSGQPVTFLVNPDQAPTGSSVGDDVTLAMNAWSTATGTSIRIVNGGTTSSCLQAGGPSLVYFDDCDGQFPAGSGCAAILGIGGVSDGGGGSVTIGGTTFIQIQQSFVTINPGSACSFTGTGGESNLQEVLTHELGHGVGLAHSWDPNTSSPIYQGEGAATPSQLAATMFWEAHFDGRGAAIQPDDLNAIDFVYPAGAGTVGTPLSVFTSSLSGATEGQPYSEPLSAAGGTPPYTWTLTSGASSLPPGITLSSGGTLSGTPTQTGVYNFTVQVTDSASATATAQLAISIGSPIGGGGAFNAQFVSQNVPTSVNTGQSFQVSLTYVNNGTSSWSGDNFVGLASQNPPHNTTWGGYFESFGTFSVSAGSQVTVTFTVFAPNTPGPYNFQWQMDQLSGVGFFGDMSPNVLITVGQPASPLSITTTSLPQVQVGSAYSQSVAATGGTPPYTWALASGTLPPGVTLNSSTGVISGAPTAVGVYSFMVTVTDSTQGTAQVALTIGVVAPTLSIGTSTLPQVQVGTAYNQQLTASGGTPPYTWAVASGAMPPGLTLSSTGLISGAPTSPGNYGFSVRVTDAMQNSSQAALSIGVLAGPLSIAPTSPPQGTIGTAFTLQLTASGGVAPYTWNVTQGNLPGGLALNGSTGTISGTPTAVGNFSFTVTVTDSQLTTANIGLAIGVVAPQPVPTISSLKYHPVNHKLVVAGQNFDLNATVLVDGFLAPIKTEAVASIVVKPIKLKAGQHSVQVVNPNGVASSTASITVP